MKETINVPMKICIYSDYFLLDTISLIPVKKSIIIISKNPKPPKLIFLRLGGKRVKTLNTS